MSMTRHDRRLLEKSRKIRTELEMLYSFRELLLQKEEDRAAAELHEAEKAAGRRFAEENFEKLDAEHVKAVILKSRIAEAENELNELKTTLLINGIHPDDAELSELKQRHEARLREIKAGVEKDMEDFKGGVLRPEVDVTEKAEAIKAAVQDIFEGVREGRLGMFGHDETRHFVYLRFGFWVVTHERPPRRGRLGLHQRRRMPSALRVVQVDVLCVVITPCRLRRASRACTRCIRANSAPSSARP